MVAGMPSDRSDFATPTLMRAARGTYARSIRAHLQAIGVEDLPRNGAFILFRLHEGQIHPWEHSEMLTTGTSLGQP